MKSIYLLVLALAVSMASCRTKEGEPGPSGESSLNKQGLISGTITYIDDNGNDATTPFNYQYFESLEDNRFYYYDEDGEEYGVQVERRDLKDANNFYSFILQGNGNNGVEEAPGQVYSNFSLFTVINNQLYKFDNNDITVTNVSIDPATGRVTFDFAGSVQDDNGNNADIVGKVDVILNRSREYISIPG